MSCPGPERIAAAVAGEDRDAAAHALGCPACRAQFDEQRQIRRLVGALSRSTLSAAERDRLADGLLARVETPSERRSFGRIAAVASLAAAVLAAVLWAAIARNRGPAVRIPDSEAVARADLPPVTASGTGAPIDAAPEPSIGETPAVPVAPAPAPVSAPAPVPSTAAIASARLSGSGAQFGRARRGGRDVIDLHNGELTIDARATAPAQIQMGGTEIRVANAKVTVTARTGVLASVAVFAGSVEVSSAARSTIVTAGTVWEAPAEPLAPEPAASLAAFREGWGALRDDRLVAAIAAFDRASDPVVREDAAYWAAVAIYRTGDRAEARRRFLDFISRFPDSARVPAARRAIENAPAEPGDSTEAASPR